jgi:hypothetical protein
LTYARTARGSAGSMSVITTSRANEWHANPS